MSFCTTRTRAANIPVMSTRHCSPNTACCRVLAESVVVTIMRQWRVFGLHSKPNWCIVRIIEPVRRPKTPFLPTLRVGTTASAAIRLSAISVRSSSNNSFSLSFVSVLKVQGHNYFSRRMLALHVHVDTVDNKPKNLFYTGVLLKHEDRLLWLTAGHVIDDLLKVES